MNQIIQTNIIHLNRQKNKTDKFPFSFITNCFNLMINKKVALCLVISEQISLQ